MAAPGPRRNIPRHTVVPLGGCSCADDVVDLVAGHRGRPDIALQIHPRFELGQGTGEKQVDPRLDRSLTEYIGAPFRVQGVEAVVRRANIDGAVGGDGGRGGDGTPVANDQRRVPSAFTAYRLPSRLPT